MTQPSEQPLHSPMGRIALNAIRWRSGQPNIACAMLEGDVRWLLRYLDEAEAAAPDPVASPADDWVICQTCEGDGGWPTSAAPVPLDHGYSPRPDWAGTCPRCGAKAGDNCAVLSDPVASPPEAVRLLNAAIGIIEGEAP